MTTEDISALIVWGILIFSVGYTINVFSQPKADKDGYARVDIQKYKDGSGDFFSALGSFIIGTLKVIGALILIGLLIWLVVAFPIAAIIILLILILLK